MSAPLDAGRLGWVAGLIDVRGYVSDRPSSHADRRLPTLAITLAALPGGEPDPIIAWLCEATGVEPIATGKGFNRSGCGAHCPEPHVHVRGTYHRWIVGGAKAVTVLRSVEPWIVSKREDVRAAIRMGGAYKPAHVAEMARRGWPGADVP